MQYGLAIDRHFVLKSSWVSKRWRASLVDNCPELWGKLTLPWREVRDKEMIPKREAWIQRSGGNFHTIDIRDTPLTGISKFTKSYESYFFTVRDLRLSMRDEKTLLRFASKFRRKCWKLEHLYLDGGVLPGKTESAMDQGWYLDHVLHCDLLGASANSTLKTLEVRNIDFRKQSDYEYDDELPRWGCDMSDVEEDVAVYPALERLIVSGCKFDIEGWMTDVSGDPDDEHDLESHRTWKCPLHKVMREAKSLQHLEIRCLSTLTSYHASFGQMTALRRTKLPDVKTCIIPPPAVWALDILTPNVERLSFVLPSGVSRDAYEKRDAEIRLPLIPRVIDSPVTQNQLQGITHLEVEACSADHIHRFGEWLSQLPNLVSLTVQGVAHLDEVLNCQASDPRGSPKRVDKCILQTLIQHPAWLPKLSDLRLRNCETPDDCLVELVKMRKTSDTMTALTTLTLQGSPPSEETHAWLHEEVPKAEGQPSGFSFMVAPDVSGGKAKDRCNVCKSTAQQRAAVAGVGR